MAGTIAVLSLVITLAVMWPGYDERSLPREHAAVWVLQNGDGKRYARVNTDVGELDTVKEVENPSQVIQHEDRTALFSDGNQRFTMVNQATPSNLGAASRELFDETPPDTVQTLQGGAWVVFRSSQGDVFAGELGQPAQPIRFTPQEGDAPGTDGVDTRADTIGVTQDGELAILTRETGTVRTVNLETRATGRTWQLPEPIEGAAQLANIAGTWTILDEASGNLWAEPLDRPIATGVEPGTLLQRSASQGTHVVMSDDSGITRVGLDGTGYAKLTEAAGTPARPFTLDGITYAAWMTEAQGTLWTSAQGTTSLNFGGRTLGDDRQPEFVSNGTRAVLNEQLSGWVWNLPDGELLPSSQEWRIDERTPQTTERMRPEQVTDPKPPIAEDDAFGVRAGRSVILPVLLNDHDPNEDVLSIVQGSVTGLDPSFGEVTLANHQQQLVVSVAPNATGTARFTYTVTDGTTSTGLNSEPATVTLTVIDDDVNGAPEWCGVEGCLAEWPVIDVSPGESETVNVLDGWVDPEGDPVYLEGVVGEVEFGKVITSPEGNVTYRHTDPNNTEPRSVVIDLVVTDTNGASTTRAITVNVQEESALRVDPFQVTGVAGLPIDIEFGGFIHGAKGVAELTALVPLDEQLADARITRQGLDARLEGAGSGTYLLQATVKDDEGETTQTVRVTVIPAEEARVSATPLTAFVRPNEDSTVDLTAAASDPAGDVLLLGDLEVEPHGNASLDVDIIGQRFLRVSGETEDGAPGTLGTARYRVSDGTGGGNREAWGEVTLVLLPASEAVAPIASPDTATVRTGELIDIPVLANDTSPAGAQLHLDPSAIVNEHDAGLAFATSTHVRYFAPDEPGTYTITYGVFVLGYPTLTSTSQVTITVTGREGNVAPTAPTLEGRVQSGNTVTIPFDPFGTDIDGDVPVLDRIVAQPEMGSASISPEGDAIVFVSEPGFQGQIRFNYRLRDDLGETATGEVRVGVLDEQSDPSPITYSDYVQVQRGAENRIVITPTDNDLDPSGTELTLVGVVPNATEDTPEYRTLNHRIHEVDLERGRIVILGSDDLGTSSFFYTVRNERGDTAMGLIVVKVVREHVPAHPRIQDTVLTHETLTQLEAGVDVITEKVSWNAGDPADLTMQLWRTEPGFSAEGHTITGSPQATARIIPFEVTGDTFTGETMTSYGFLRIPGEATHTLSLKTAYRALEVAEHQSIDVDLTQAISIPAGETLEILPASAHTSGLRGEASCVVQGTTLRYTAGEGAPWRDVCTFQATLAGHTDPTELAIHFSIIAEDPEPILRPATITVRPGETADYTLSNMVDWDRNGTETSVTLTTSYRGELFTVTQQGDNLQIRAHDDARQSRQEQVQVALASHPDVAPATLTLTVGRSPQTLPKGASVAHECSQTNGATECLFDVIGERGEVNPLPGTPLSLVSVTHPANCPSVRFEVASATSVRATWTDDTSGAADCRATFIVKDAQGRTSSGDRTGQIMFDLMGLPANPTRLDWVSFDDRSVTLRAVSERQSIPQITGYLVTGAGRTVECPATGECTIEGLDMGTPHTFTATAVNRVGESRGHVTVNAWPYRAPNAPKAAHGTGWVPVPNGAIGGKVELSLTDIDPSTRALRVKGETVDLRVPVTGTSMTFAVETGSNDPMNLSITPETKHPVPEIAAPGASEGKNLPLSGVHGIGAPVLRVTATPQPAERSIRVEASVQNNGSKHVSIGYALGKTECVPVKGAPRTHTFTNVARDENHQVTVCAAHTFEGRDGFGTAKAVKDVLLTIPAPSPATYTIGGEAVEIEPHTWVWKRVTTTATASPGYVLEYVAGGTRGTTINDVFPAPGDSLTGPITIRNCAIDPDTDPEMQGPGSECGQEVILTPTGAHVSPIVTFIDRVADDGFCTVEDAEDAVVIVGHEAEARIREVIEEPFGAVRIFVDFPSLGLGPVTSPPCVPEPDEAEGAGGHPDIANPIDPVLDGFEPSPQHIERNEV